MCKSPLFTVTVLAALTLAIAADSAVFSIVHTLLLQPLPYADSERLAWIVLTEQSSGTLRRTALVDSAQLNGLRQSATTISYFSAIGTTALTVDAPEGAVQLDGSRVSADMFQMLGVRPLLGRVFSKSEERRGADQVIVLSWSAWVYQFASDPSIVGRVVLANSVPRKIVAVMPREFAFPDHQIQFWVPYVEPQAGEQVPVMVRIKRSATLSAARAELNTLIVDRRIAVRPGRRGLSDEPNPVELVGAQEQMVAPVRPALLLLSAAVTLLLLIACVNVTNLLLARATLNRADIAVRYALGAGRGRLLRQALTETTILTLMGGVSGFAVAGEALATLKKIGVALPRHDLGLAFSIPRLEDVHLDSTVLLFTMATSMIAGIASGLIPAVRSTAQDPNPVLRAARGEPAAERTSSSRLWTHRLLIAFEVSFTLPLVVIAALVTDSFVKMSRVSLGFDPKGVLTLQIIPPAGRYPDARVVAFATRVVERLSDLPSVQEVSYAETMPMVQLRAVVRLQKTSEPLYDGEVAPFGVPPPPEWPNAHRVSYQFFDTLKIRTESGRTFTPRDDGAGAPAVVINRFLANSGFLGASSPVGKRIFISGAKGVEPWEIIGVVNDVREFGLDQPVGAQIYFPYPQRPMPPLPPGVGLYFVVRANASNESILINAVCSTLRQLEPAAAISNVAPLTDVVKNASLRQRLNAYLFSVFAVVAVALALSGVYGVVAYIVGSRTRDICVKMALGARTSNVLVEIGREVFALVTIGIVVGIGWTLAAVSYLQSAFFGTSAIDWRTLIGAASSFAVIALVASLVPAAKAASMDPVTALRSE
jgi:putative ABC transport system permease protein